MPLDGHTASATPRPKPTPWVCLCGGQAWTRDDLIATADYDGEIDWVEYWASILGPFDFYCPDEDDVLTDKEALRVRGLHVRTHDDPLNGEWFW